MSNQSFEYNLVLRIREAEEAISRVAERMEATFTAAQTACEQTTTTTVQRISALHAASARAAGDAWSREWDRQESHHEALVSRSVAMATSAWSKAYDKQQSDAQTAADRILDIQINTAKAAGEAWSRDYDKQQADKLRGEEEYSKKILDMQISTARAAGDAWSKEYDRQHQGQKTVEAAVTKLSSIQTNTAKQIGSAWSKEYDKKIADTSKLSAANDKAYQKMLRDTLLLGESDRRRYEGLTHYETALAARHNQTKLQILAAIDQREAKGEAWFKNELNRIRQLAAAERDREIRNAGEQTNRDLAAFAGGGRTVSNMFQIQQAFEDAQYAGLRGAANNIAMMAANMGGSAGVIALGGIMAAQLATSAGLWETINEWSGGYFWTLKSITEEEEKQLELGKERIGQWQSQAEKVIDFKPDDYAALKMTAESEQARIASLTAINEQLNRAKSAYEGMAKYANILEQGMASGWTGRFSTSPQESLEQINAGEYKRKLAQRNFPPEMREAFEDTLSGFAQAQQTFIESSGGLSITEEGYEAIKKAIAENEAELVKHNATLKTTVSLMSSMKEVADAFKSMMRDTWKDAPVFQSKDMKGEAKSDFERQAGIWENHIDQLQESSLLEAEILATGLQADLAEAQRLGNDKAAKEIQEKINKIYEDRAQLIREAITLAREDLGLAREHYLAETEKQEAAKEAEKEHNEQLKEKVQLAKENVSAIEKELRHTESLVKADERRLEVLEAQHSAMQDEFGKQNVDAEAKHIKHVADLEKEEYKERAKRGRDAFMDQVKAAEEYERRLLEYRKRHNPRGKGDADPDKDLQEDYNRRKAAHDKYVQDQIRWNEQADEHNLKRIERQAELEQKKVFEEYDKQQRMKLESLQKQAKDFEDAGDTENALDARRQIDKLLKELQSSQERQIGQGTQAESRAAADALKALQQQRVDNSAQTIALAKAEHEAHANRQAELEAGLRRAQGVLEEMSDVPIPSADAEQRLNGLHQQLLQIRDTLLSMPAFPLGASGIPNPGETGRPFHGPGYAEGTDYVPETGLALIHQGEMIIPAEEAAAIRAARDQSSSSGGFASGQMPDFKPWVRNLASAIYNTTDSALNLFAQGFRHTVGETSARKLEGAVGSSGLTNRISQLGDPETPAADLKREKEEHLKAVNEWNRSWDARAKEYSDNFTAQAKVHDAETDPEARKAASKVLHELNDGWAEYRKIMEGAAKDLEAYRQDLEKRGAELEKDRDTSRKYTGPAKPMPSEEHAVRMAEIRERSSKEALDRAESAQRVRKLEQEAQVTRDRLAAGPESTPDYIARRRLEIAGRRSSINQGWLAGYDERQKIKDPDAYIAQRDMSASIEELGTEYADLQSRIVDEIEKTNRMVEESKNNIKWHEDRKADQRQQAGFELSDRGWRQKPGTSMAETGDDPNGVFKSPETQAVEDRLERERARQAQLNRARQLSGQSLDQRSAAEAQDAMKMEESMERSAAQKAYMESLKAVKEAEVLSAEELAAALERSAAAKATLEATGVGAGSGGGDSGSGLVGSFAVGTAYVPKTGLALIHKGEMIIPASMADEIRSGSVGGQAGSSGQDVVSRLDRVLSKHITPLSRHMEQLATAWRGGGSRQSNWLEYAEASRRAMEATPNPGYLGDMPIPKNEFNPIPNQDIPMPHRGYNVTANGLGGMQAPGAGGGANSYTTVNNTMQATMVPASPNSVFAAMATAAQINNIRRR